MAQFIYFLSKNKGMILPLASRLQCKYLQFSYKNLLYCFLLLSLYSKNYIKVIESQIRNCSQCIHLIGLVCFLLNRFLPNESVVHADLSFFMCLFHQSNNIIPWICFYFANVFIFYSTSLFHSSFHLQPGGTTVNHCGYIFFHVWIMLFSVYT